MMPMEYGFAWGPVAVTRLVSDPKYGVVILLKSEKQRLEVRVTPKGLIRLDRGIQP